MSRMAARVSIATVSPVISGSASVTPNSAQRAHRVADQLSYRPSIADHGLARRYLDRPGSNCTPPGTGLPAVGARSRPERGSASSLAGARRPPGGRPWRGRTLDVAAAVPARWQPCAATAGTHRHVGLCSDGTHRCQDRFDLAAVEVDPTGGGDDRLRMFELDDVVGGDAAAVTVGSADHFGGGDQGHLGAWAHAPSTDPERTC